VVDSRRLVVHRANQAAGKEAVMKVVALISWIVTALGGATLLSIWLVRGGLRQRGQGADASRFPPPLIFGHGLLAATGLVIWIIYLATDADALRWVAFAILLVVATLGFTMARLWRQERAAAEVGTGQPSTALPPEQHFPVALIGLHGLLAITTLVLVLLTALGVGD
jgi:flagellar basal body-associated protein FliL